MREASTPAASSASRCGASVCDPSALDTLTYPMSIATPPTSPFLQGLLAPVFDERDDREVRANDAFTRQRETKLD